jgi:ATP synthase protein I
VFVAVGLQFGIVAVLALGAGLLADWESARSLALGGAAAAVPNGLFALRLAMHKGRSPESYPVVFFLGEFLKIGMTIGFLGLIVRYGGDDVRWLPLLIGLIAALKVTLFALAFTSRNEPGGPRDEHDTKTARSAAPSGRETTNN